MKHNVSYEYTRDNIKVAKCWHSPNNNCQPHFHSSLEFVYLLDGHMNALLDSHPVSAFKGDIIIVPSYTIHTYTTVHSSDTYVLTIPSDLIPSFLPILDKKTFAAVYIPYLHRYSVGVTPICFLKAMQKLFSLLKPQEKAISFMVLSVERR